MSNIVTPADLAALRKDYFVSLNSFTDQELTLVLLHDESVLHCARRWGWNDTEARDNFSRSVLAVTGRDVD